MLDPALIITFNLVLLAAILSPGPAFFFIMTTSLSRGRAARFAAGLGLGSMAALWTLLAVLGLEGPMALVPGPYLAIRIAGALYLLWIAAGPWRDKGLPDTEPSGDRAFSGGLQHLFMRGFIINLMNPKSVVFAASVIVMIFLPDISLGAMMAVPVNHLLIVYIVYFAFAFAFVFPWASVRRGYLRRRVIFNRAAAIIMAGLALRMAVGG